MTRDELVTIILDADEDSDLSCSAEVRFGTHAFDTQFEYVRYPDLIAWYRDFLEDYA